MRKSSVVVFVVGAALLLRSAGAAVPVAGFTVVAESGKQAPGQPIGAKYTGAFVAPVIAESGEEFYASDLFGGGVPGLTTGFFLGLPGAMRVVAREGQPAPGAGASWKDLAGFTYVARAGGLVAFVGTIDLADADHDVGIWAGPVGSLTLAAREGDPTPGLPFGVVYADMAGSGAFAPALNAAGQIAFRALLTGSGVTSFDDEAVFAGAPGAVALVAREGALAPGAAGAKFLLTDIDQVVFSRPSINTAGKVLFVSSLAGAGVSSGNAAGIWFGFPGSLSLVLRAGVQPPGMAPGRFFKTFDPVLNDFDQILFAGGTSDSLGLNPVFGVWLGSGGTFAKLAAQGEQAPSEPGGVVFGSSFSSQRLNGAGQAAFVASLSDFGSGVYGYDPVMGLTRLARSSTQAPGMAPGEQFTSFQDPIFLNAAGKVLIRNVTSLGKTGLWIADVATGQVDLLASTGVPTVVDGLTRTFDDIRVGGTGDPQDGRASPIADDGNVTFLVNPNGAGRAIIRTGSVGGVNTPPAFVRPIIVTPNPVVAGKSVKFVALARDPDKKDKVKYTWHYGDGWDGTNASRTYIVTGRYEVSATASDGRGGFAESAKASVFVVDPGTPYFDVATASAALNFRKLGKDVLKVSGQIRLDDGTPLEGKVLSVDFGGVVRDFTLDAKGKSPKGPESARVWTPKAGVAKFSATLTGDCAGQLVDEGMTNADVADVDATTTIRVTFDGVADEEVHTMIYAGKAGISGAAK